MVAQEEKVGESERERETGKVQRPDDTNGFSNPIVKYLFFTLLHHVQYHIRMSMTERYIIIKYTKRIIIRMMIP